MVIFMRSVMTVHGILGLLLGCLWEIRWQLTAQGKPEDDYRVQGIVGVGSFGVVRKVQHGHPGLDPKDPFLARSDWIAVQRMTIA